MRRSSVNRRRSISGFAKTLTKKYKESEIGSQPSPSTNTALFFGNKEKSKPGMGTGFGKYTGVAPGLEK
jgi:hypothetical protein